VEKIYRERLEQWATALESNETYVQAKGALYFDVLPGKKNMCCLGVACDVSGVGRWEGDAYVTPRRDATDEDDPERSLTSLTLQVCDYYGLEDTDPLLRGGDGVFWRATTLNDRYGYTFQQIAAAIRRTYLTDEDDVTT